MKIIHDYPPNYGQIVAEFGKSALIGAIYTYGDTIYVPNGKTIPDHLIHHEEVHIKQQAKEGPIVWWIRYLADTEFRLEQELEAYKAEYRFVCSNYNREARRELLTHMVNSLSSAMYGNIISKELAKELIVG